MGTSCIPTTIMMSLKSKKIMFSTFGPEVLKLESLKSKQDSALKKILVLAQDRTFYDFRFLSYRGSGIKTYTWTYTP